MRKKPNSKPFGRGGSETITVVKKKQSSAFSMDKNSLRHRLQLAFPHVSLEVMADLVQTFSRWIDKKTTSPKNPYLWLFDVLGAIWARQDDKEKIELIADTDVIYSMNQYKSGPVEVKGYYYDGRIYDPDGVGYKIAGEPEAGIFDFSGLTRAITLRNALIPVAKINVRSGTILPKIQKNRFPFKKYVASKTIPPIFKNVENAEMVFSRSSMKYRAAWMQQITAIALENWSNAILSNMGNTAPTELDRARVIQTALESAEAERNNYCVHYYFRTLFDSGINDKKIFSIATAAADANHQHLCHRCSTPILCEHNYILKTDNAVNNPIKSYRFDTFATRVNNEYFCKWCGYKLMNVIDDTVVDFNDSKEFSVVAEISLDQNFISNCSQILYLTGFKSYFTPQSIFRDLEPHLITLAKKDISDNSKEIHQNMLVIAYLIRKYIESKTDKPFIRDIAASKKEINDNRLEHAISSIIKLFDKHESLRRMIPALPKQKLLLGKMVGRLFTESRTRDLSESRFKRNLVSPGYIIIVDPIAMSFSGVMLEENYPDTPINERAEIFANQTRPHRERYRLVTAASSSYNPKTAYTVPEPADLLFPNGAADVNRYKMREMENFCTDGSLHQFNAYGICLNCGILASQTHENEKVLLKLHDKIFGRDIQVAKPVPREYESTSVSQLLKELRDPSEYYKISGVDVKAAKAFFDGAGKIYGVENVRDIMDPSKLEDIADYSNTEPDIIRRAIVSFFTSYSLNFKTPVPKNLSELYNRVMNVRKTHSEKIVLYKKLLATILINTIKSVAGAIPFHKQFFAEANTLQNSNTYDIMQYVAEREAAFMKKIANFVTNASKTMEQKVRELFGDNPIDNFAPELIEDAPEVEEDDESVEDKIDESNKFTDDDVSDDIDT